MSQTYAYQVDDETATLIEMDRDALSQTVGRKLTSSQYHRLVILDRVRNGVGNPIREGWSEGFKSGLADFIETLRANVATTVALYERQAP